VSGSRRGSLVVWDSHTRAFDRPTNRGGFERQPRYPRKPAESSLMRTAILQRDNSISAWMEMNLGPLQTAMFARGCQIRGPTTYSIGR
jgi:hypothetical protein